MDSQFPRRRPHGFVDDTPEQVPDHGSLTSPFQPSFTYPPAPPQSSTFSYPTTTNHLSYTPEGQVLTTLVTFHGAPPQDAPADYSQQYQQHHPAFCEQPQLFSQYQPQSATQHQPYYPSRSSRKRQRRDSDMPLPFFPRASVSHDSQEKLSGSEIADENENNPGITMFQQLESFCCPPWPDYSTPTVYNSISSSPIYESSTVPAYSTNLESPNHHQISQHQVITSSGAEQSSLFLLSADSQPSQQLQEKFPPLQPVTYLSTLPPVGQEPMSYQSFSSQQNSSKSDDTGPTFRKSEVPEHEYQSVDYRTGSNTSLGVATDFTAAGMPESKTSPCINHDLVRYAAPQRYQLSHSYGPQEPVRTEQFAYIPFNSQGNRVEVVLPNQKPQATKRGPFKDPQKRAKTAQVRKIGSCIRCRMQRIRCEFDPDQPDDENAPCDGCKKIIANSKVHRMPCKRWKLTDIKLSKPGQVDEPDLKWTHRWQDSATLPEITQWANAEIRSIRLTDGYGKAITVKVRRFKELPSDKKERFIRYDDGTEETIPTEPFGLVDVEAVKMEYERYLRSGRAHICKALCGPREKLLWKTYQLAWERRDNPRIHLEERDLLSRTLDLWVAVRLTTKSFEITGDETLGIPPDRTGKIVLPPVMGAQLDKIIIDHILPKLRRETLETLQTMTQQKKQKTWMTTYLVTFMLLHNVALITKHDKNYAKKHNMKEKFGKEWARAKMVRQYHLGANILLAYFHYCNKGLYPFSQECKESDLQSLAELDEAGLDFVKRTRVYVEDHKRDWEYLRQSNNPEDYGDDYYFISQLFEQNWLPRDTTIIG